MPNSPLCQKILLNSCVFSDWICDLSSCGKKGNDLDLRIRGPLIHVALFEIYLLAIISELNTFFHFHGFSREIGRKRLMDKINLLHSQGQNARIRVCRFRYTVWRASRDWQQEVLEILSRTEKVPQIFYRYQFSLLRQNAWIKTDRHHGT